ncbi:MAG TPA: hypothetical protein VK158_02995 [Acidobacteriota bacterium]|nr:hypothetical protein [Acidobacteriota bacterium]
MEQRIKLTALLAIAFCVLMSSTYAANYVVVNSREWHDLYLGAVYAGFTNATVMSFDNLGNAQLKSQVIEQDGSVIVLEPKTGSVVKKYESYLTVNGYANVKTVSYSTYADLQSTLYESLPEQSVNGFALLYPRFGVEATVLVPVLYNERLWPLFVSDESLDSVSSLVSKEDKLLAAGHFPIRLLDGSLGSRVASSDYPDFTKTVDENVVAISKFVSDNYEYRMGVISRIDRIDLMGLKIGNPQFVYYGSAEDVASQVKASSLTLFEVISSDTADVAKSIESQSGRNLQLLVKYARGFANIPGMKGQLLDLDTVAFDYPVQAIEPVSATFYPAEGVLSLTFANRGNVDTRVFSTVEFGGQSYLDEKPFVIPAQEIMSIPYQLDGAPNPKYGLRVVLNTLYGDSDPLRKNVLSANGAPLVTLNATQSSVPQDASLVPIDVILDDTRGVLLVSVQNTMSNSAIGYVQVRLHNGSTIVGSRITEFSGSKTQSVDVPVPYLAAADIIEEPLDIRVYYGQSDTIFASSASVPVSAVIESKKPMQLSTNTLIIIGMTIVILLLVILLVRRKPPVQPIHAPPHYGHAGYPPQGHQPHQVHQQYRK